MPTITLNNKLGFPMAKGFGKNAYISPTAPIIRVTSTNARGAGTLHEALYSSSSDRHIVFDVGGVFDTGADMYNIPGNVFIHGETAPGTGVTLTSQSGGMRWNSGNIIIRNVRFRDSGGALSMFSFYNTLSLNNYRNVIVDRCSFSWPTGNNPNTNEMMIAISKLNGGPGVLEDITIQRCIFAEGTRGVLISQGAEHVTLWRNFYNDPGFRTPISGYPDFGSQEKVVWESINQISHNPYQNMIAGVGSKVSIVGTKMTLAPGAQFPFQGMLRFESYGGCDGNCSSSTEGYIYLNDNSVPSGVNFVGGADATQRVQNTPYEPLSIDSNDILPVSEIDDILPSIGCFPRDQYDTNYINEYITNTGTQGTTTGTLNTSLYSNGTKPVDSNNDGIPDNFTSQHNITSASQIKTNWDFGSYNVVNNAGYTALEMYWAYLAGDFESLNVNDSVPNVSLSERLAFPTAEGFGKNTTGGRGGTVYHVTTLADSGPGSFREAYEAKGDRIIVFDIAGDIYPTGIQYILNGTSKGDGNLTIAGQTAPSPGITIRTDNISSSAYGAVLDINQSNVIIRYLTVRDVQKFQGNPNWENTKLDCIHAVGDGGITLSNIIIDHCSMSHGGDEIFSLQDINNFTLQKCMIAYPTDSGATLVGNRVYNSSFYQNMYTHSFYRNPLVGYGQNNETTEWINNIIFGFTVGGTDIVYGNVIDVLGHVYKMWGNNTFGGRAINWSANAINNPNGVATDGGFYVADTMYVNPERFTYTELQPVDLAVMKPSRQLTNSLITNWKTTIQEVEDDILNDVGNSIFRDATDTEAINDYINTANQKTLGVPNKSSVSRPANYYVSNPDIPEFFVQAHGITSNSQIITNWNFGTYTVTNTAEYSAFEMYLAWAAGDLDKIADKVSVIEPPVDPPVNEEDKRRFLKNSNNLIILN